jgi:type VI protein secretion system component VasF
MKPEDILDRPDDKEFLKEFIKGAHQVHTGLFQMYRIASDIHLAQSLREAAKQSSRHTRALLIATWALVLATVVLVVVTWLNRVGCTGVPAN